MAKQTVSNSDSHISLDLQAKRETGDLSDTKVIQRRIEILERRYFPETTEPVHFLQREYYRTGRENCRKVRETWHKRGGFIGEEKIDIALDSAYYLDPESIEEIEKRLSRVYDKLKNANPEEVREKIKGLFKGIKIPRTFIDEDKYLKAGGNIIRFNYSPFKSYVSSRITSIQPSLPFRNPLEPLYYETVKEMFARETSLPD